MLIHITILMSLIIILCIVITMLSWWMNDIHRLCVILGYYWGAIHWVVSGINISILLLRYLSTMIEILEIFKEFFTRLSIKRGSEEVHEHLSEMTTRESRP